MILKDASAWELLNIPVDEAIDIFVHLLQDIKDSGDQTKTANIDA